MYIGDLPPFLCAKLTFLCFHSPYTSILLHEFVAMDVLLAHCLVLGRLPPALKGGTRLAIEPLRGFDTNLVSQHGETAQLQQGLLLQN